MCTSRLNSTSLPVHAGSTKSCLGWNGPILTCTGRCQVHRALNEHSKVREGTIPGPIRAEIDGRYPVPCTWTLPGPMFGTLKEEQPYPCATLNESALPLGASLNDLPLSLAET